MATLGHRLNLATNTSVSCWMVQHNGGNLLDGNITDYLLRRKHDSRDGDEVDMSDGTGDVVHNGSKATGIDKEELSNDIDDLSDNVGVKNAVIGDRGRDHDHVIRTGNDVIRDGHRVGGVIEADNEVTDDENVIDLEYDDDNADSDFETAHVGIEDSGM